LHDLVHLERRGIPAVGVATAPFADEAIEQARRLGMPGARMVYIPHPVQLLTDDELNARADAIFPDVLAALTGGEADQSPGASAAP
jgi:uracil-DNA glycosylase